MGLSELFSTKRLKFAGVKPKQAAERHLAEGEVQSTLNRLILFGLIILSDLFHIIRTHEIWIRAALNFEELILASEIQYQLDSSRYISWC